MFVLNIFISKTNRFYGYIFFNEKKINVLLVVYRKSTAKLLGQDLAAFSKIKRNHSLWYKLRNLEHIINHNFKIKL